MAADTTGYFSAVDDLISICKDAEEGFRAAAKAVETNPTLQSTFEEYAKQRAKFGKDLQLALRDSGAAAPDSSELGNTLHNAWIALKGVLTGGSEHQILVETEAGEDLSVQRYKDALATNLPGHLRTIVKQQYEQVQIAHNHIRNLRDKTAH